VPGIMAHHGRGNWIVRGVGTQQEGMGQESATSIYIDDTYFYWALPPDFWCSSSFRFLSGRRAASSILHTAVTTKCGPKLLTVVRWGARSPGVSRPL
jgi:hypothetical protein